MIEHCMQHILVYISNVKVQKYTKLHYLLV